MRGTQYGRRIAHGALLVGYMSRASTMIVGKIVSETSDFIRFRSVTTGSGF